MDLPPGGLHGAYKRKCLEESMGAYVLRKAVRDGWLKPFSRTVLVDARRAAEFLTRAAAALLHFGDCAALYGHSGLAMHGCTGAKQAPIHLLVRYECRARTPAGVVAHRGRYEEQDVSEIVDLRTLSLDVALSQVLCRGSRSDGIACADQALALLPAHERAEFRAWVHERIRRREDWRGRNDAQLVLGLATGLAESPPESHTLLKIFEAGLPIPEQQVPIRNLAG